MNENSTQNDTPAKKPAEIAPIPEGKSRGWELTVDGNVITVERFSLANSKFGSSIEFGLRQEGYDGFVIRERGGSVTIPWAITEDGQILIGLVSEYRPNTGFESTLNAPRGMANIGEDRHETATRELEEETGYKTDVGEAAMRLSLLADDVNANSTYFDTSREENPGTAFFSLQVPVESLELDYDNDGSVHYTFPDHIKKNAQDAPTERIFGSKFIPLHEALQSRDMFTGYAVGQLLGKLLEDGNYIVPQLKEKLPTKA